MHTVDLDPLARLTHVRARLAGEPEPRYDLVLPVNFFLADSLNEEVRLLPLLLWGQIQLKNVWLEQDNSIKGGCVIRQKKVKPDNFQIELNVALFEWFLAYVFH